MNKETTPDMEWAKEKLVNGIHRYEEDQWNFLLKEAQEFGMGGMHQQIALVLIAKGIYSRPIEEVIKKLKNEGLADGAGIDSARNK